MQKTDETAIEYLRRVVSNLNFEQETELQDLPTPQACSEFFELFDKYGTDLLQGVIESIEDGKDAVFYNNFVSTWQLPWNLYTAGAWEPSLSAKKRE